MRRVIRAILAALLLTVAAATSATGAQALNHGALAAEVCEARVESPHYSTGAQGIIFKTRTWCGNRTVVRVIGYLYSCNREPNGSGTAARARAGCILRYSKTYPNFLANPGTTYTRYFPPAGERGVAYRAGWWLSVGVFTTQGDTEQFWNKKLN